VVVLDHPPASVMSRASDSFTGVNASGPMSDNTMGSTMTPCQEGRGRSDKM